MGQRDSIEVAGVIKWFDMSRGYGFVVPDDGGPDIMLHVTVLKRSEFQTAYEGAHIVCEVQKHHKGSRVSRVITVDNSTVIDPQDMTRTECAEIANVSGFEISIVKWFNRVKGFGFLTCGEGTDDIFLHKETVRRCGLAEPKSGDGILVRYGDGPKGLLAVEVRSLSETVLRANR